MMVPLKLTHVRNHIPWRIYFIYSIFNFSRMGPFTRLPAIGGSMAETNPLLPEASSAVRVSIQRHSPKWTQIGGGWWWMIWFEHWNSNHPRCPVQSFSRTSLSTALMSDMEGGLLAKVGSKLESRLRPIAKVSITELKLPHGHHHQTTSNNIGLNIIRYIGLNNELAFILHSCEWSV